MRDRWRVATAAHEENETGYVFDGDGRPVIEKEGMRHITTPDPDPMVIYTEGYQVWSSVLGSSLTTVDTEGDKRHTKVFAGGAHIATQDANATTSTGDDRILFTSADPVTGTKVTFDYTDGTSYFAREDTEPLGGQQIERNDPGTGYPTDYEQVLGSPRDPEWQCMLPKEFYGGFGGMPVHCQKAKLESKDFSIAAEFGFSVRESNPKKISAPDSPMPNIPGIGTGDSPSSLVLARSARATYKQSTDSIGGDEGCDPDDPKNPCFVQSERWVDDPTDPIRAENVGVGLNLQDPTPCDDLARRAQEKRDEWVNNWESQGKTWDVYLFDKSFAPLYIGKPVTGGLKDNIYFYQTKGGRATLYGKSGQNDFKDKYLDTDYPRDSTDPRADQAHHFVAYFSAGINGAYWSTVAHSSTDGFIYRSLQSKKNGGPYRPPNTGDIELGNDAYALGEEVRKDPSLLKDIGKVIRERFCR